MRTSVVNYFTRTGWLPVQWQNSTLGKKNQQG